jgi:ATP-dependent exoDNAse (exonuclease V) beta subunit
MTAMATLFDADALHGPTPPGRRELTPAQAAAVGERSRSLLVSANAGSGKTSVLVERFVRAVREDGTDPSRILAITFTDKAAGELRERLRARFLELGDRETARAPEAAFVATLPGFCSRVLRSHSVAAGLDPRFAVLDEPRAARLREGAFADALRGFLADGGRPALDLVAAHTPDGLRRMILAVHDELRSQGQERPRLPAVAPRPAPDAEREALHRARAAFAAELAEAGDGRAVEAARDALDACARLLDDLEAHVVPWPGRLRALEVMCGRAGALQTDTCRAYVQARDAFEHACADHHAARAVPLLDDLLGRFGAAYAAGKARRGALDFDDLELGARSLLATHPAVRRAWAERFALVMVDEFQDTNRRQLELLEALEHDNLCCVGDEFQSIYGFRHADVEIFRARRAKLGALELAESFRGRPEVLAVLNGVFADRFGESFVPLAPARPAAGDGPRVELLVTDQRDWDEVDLGDTLPSRQAWRRAEARLVAQRLRELVDAGEARAGDIAVLVRATAAMPLYERALADVGLATLATAGRGFWSRQEVVDLTSYLGALANPLHERALVGTLASPLAGVSADGLAIATTGAHEAGRGLWWALESTFADGEDAQWVALLEPGDHAALAAFVPRFAAERGRAPRLALDELLERAIAAAGYDLHVLGLLGGARRMANVDKLLRLARDFEAAEGRDLRGFVDHAAALEQAQRREPEAPVEDPDQDAVRLMTIHAAKGLEFDVTVVADLGRRGNLQTPDLLVDGDRVGLRLSLLDGSRPAPALAYAELKDRRQLADAREEDRVLYVALTRARERLILAGGADPERWPKEAPGAPPLSWLGPALVPDLSERLREATADTAADTVGGVRVMLNAPATLGAVLREECRAPAGTEDVPLADPRPVAAAAAPSTPPAQTAAPGPLSYTALAGYARCGYRFYAQRVLGLPDVAPPAADAPAAGEGAEAAAARDRLSARERGVLVHALVEQLDFARPAAHTGAHVAELAARLGMTAAPADVERARVLADAFAGGEVAARLARAGTVRREHEFAFELEPGAGPLLTGAVDLLAVEPGGGWLIVDVKTDEVAGGAGLAAAVEGDYAVQRELYALAALRAGAPRVDVVYAYLARPDEPVTATYEAADAPGLATRLAALTGGIAAGAFAPTDMPHAGLCATCPARDRLCPHPREVKMRRLTRR